jgi:hypothetical protein
MGALGIVAGIQSDKIDSCRLHQLHHPAADLPVRGVLFDPLAVAVLAGGVAFNPVFT